MRMLSVLGCCLAVLLSTTLDARQWKFVDGAVLEAELVSSNDSCITLQPAQQPMASYPLAALSREDRSYVRQQTLARLAALPLTTTAEARWHFTSYYPPDGPPTPMLGVMLTTHGQEIANAGRTGDLQIELLETDASTQPTPPESDSRSSGKLGTAERGADTPPYTVHYWVNLETHGEPITRIRRFKGSYKIETGDRHTIVVKNVARSKDIVVNDPILKQLKLKMVANSSNPGEVVEPTPGMQCRTLDVVGAPGKILDVSWVDRDGVPCKEVEGGRSASFDPEAPDTSTAYYYAGFESPVPRDMELRITLLTNPREERVPFDIVDVKVPEQPEPPSAPSQIAAEVVSVEASASLPAAQAAQAPVRTKKVATGKRNRRRFR